MLVGAAAVAAWKHFDDGAKEARSRWERDRKSVEKTLKEHRKHLAKHLAEAQDRADFVLLVDVHFSSHRVGDAAYKLLDDARISLRAMNSMLRDIDENGVALERSMRRMGPTQRTQLAAEIASLVQMYDAIVPDRDAVVAQAGALRDDVAGMNAQTRELKLAIRDRCGSRGRDWFDRLEERTRQREKDRPTKHGGKAPARTKPLRGIVCSCPPCSPLTERRYPE